MQIRGSVHLEHLEHRASAISMLPVLRLQLTCVPVIRPAATGVNVIKDTPGMDWTAQVSYL